MALALSREREREGGGGSEGEGGRGGEGGEGRARENTSEPQRGWHSEKGAVSEKKRKRESVPYVHP